MALRDAIRAPRPGGGRTDAGPLLVRRRVSISPEAPVPVVHVTRNEDRIGGAGNVARNAAALGAQVTLLSVAGRDEADRRCEPCLLPKLSRSTCTKDPAYSTITKTACHRPSEQLLARGFRDPARHEVLAAKLEAYGQLLADCDVVVLSITARAG